MKSPLLPATAVALLVLSACQSKTTTTVDNSATENKTVVTTKRVELPPPIKAEVSFRCHGDNSSVKVSFFDGDKLVSVQSPADAPPVSLKAPEAGKPYVADGGWELTGTPKSIKLTQPGKPAQTCDA
ncbi:MAG: hypothetical protein V4459_13435 [Pseudomonadota bacterium]